MKKLEKAIIDYEELESYIDSLDFGDLYGKNRFSEILRKMRKNIKRIEVVLDEQIRTKDFKTPLCYYCKEKIPSGTRHYKCIGGQYKKLSLFLILHKNLL